MAIREREGLGEYSVGTVYSVGTLYSVCTVYSIVLVQCWYSV